MGLGHFLNHRVSIVRQVATGALDDYGQPVVAVTTLASDVPVGLQPKSVSEQARVSQAGAAIGKWTVFMRPRDVTEADAIVHDASACPLAAGRDLNDGRFEITGVRMEAGVAHHLAIDATFIETAESPVEPEVVADGS